MDVLNIKAGISQYSVYVGKGFRESIAQRLKEAYPKSRFAIITDDNVYAIYGQQMKEAFEKNDLSFDIIPVKPGEKSKSIAIFGDVISKLAQLNYNRADVIVALGGGIVGDLSGFVAASFLRGVRYIQIPTTLLSQIDSSIGGKTAVNIAEGKNLVGAFYHPSAVYIDIEFLRTLKKQDFADGMAEIIKTGLIKDQDMFERLEASQPIDAHSESLKDIIIRCLQIKTDVVAADERDKGERMKLNFGHTIGHGLERICAKDASITHGQGVAIGMVAITQASERLGQTQAGTTARIIALLDKTGLPTSIDKFDKDEILQGIFVDKKNVADRLNIILISEPGSAFIHKITKHDMQNYL